MNSDELAIIIEAALDIRFSPSVSNNPVPQRTITFINGIPKDEGEPIVAESASREMGIEMTIKNLCKQLSGYTHLVWRVKPYFEGNNLRCRIII